MKTYKADLAKDFGEDPRNANKGTERGKKMLDKSVTDLGAGRSIVVDKNGLVIAGNKTRQAMVETGISDAVVVETNGHQMVVVKRMDLDLTDRKGKARQLAYADNRVGELNLSWDMAIVNEDIDIVGDMFGDISADNFNAAAMDEMYDAGQIIDDDTDVIKLKYPTEKCAEVLRALKLRSNNPADAVLELLGLT